MAPATQREALPNDAKSLIRRLGEELSCSIWYIFLSVDSFYFILLLSLCVFDDPTMTPCNHTFCRYFICKKASIFKFILVNASKEP
jgi:hypothetical protein